jgi:hypothetical protein
VVWCDVSILLYRAFLYLDNCIMEQCGVLQFVIFALFQIFHIFSYFIFPFFSYFLFCISVKEGYLKMGTGSVSQLIKRNREDTVTGGSEVLSEMLPVYPIRPV